MESNEVGEKLATANEASGFAIAVDVPKAPLRLMSKADILATADREYRVIPMGQWWGGMSVRVRSLTAGERDAWEASHVKQRKGESVVNIQTVRASLVQLSLVDEENRLMFDASEVAVLQQKHAAAIDHIYGICAALNGVTDKDVEELMGNSGSAPGGAS